MANNVTLHFKRLLTPRCMLALVWLVASLFYFWTATSSARPVIFGTDQDDFYNLQATGYLRGQLSVPRSVPQGLLSLPNPYDPVANGGFQAPIHDLSLYHGHLYLPWGPTPAVSLFTPWRILQIGQLHTNLALLIYAWIGLAATLALLATLIDHFQLKPPLWKVVIAGLLLAAGSVVPYLLRTSDRDYEVAIAGGYCFALLGLYLLVSGALAQRTRLVRLGLGSLCLGLAAGSRWNLVIFALPLLALYIWMIKKERLMSWWGRVQLGAIIVGPWAAIVALLLVYNVARFGNPLEFGTKYQLAGFDPSSVKYYQLSYLVPSLYSYVVSPVHWILAFPFFTLPRPNSFPGTVPPGYATEIIGGVLTTTPILLMLFIAPYLLHKKGNRELSWLIASSVFLSILILGVISFSIPGGTMRYEADFATLLLLPAAVVWMISRGRLFGILGLLLAVYSILVGFAISVAAEFDSLRQHNPGAFATLEQATSPLPTLIAKVVGHPMVTRVIDPHPSYPDYEGAYGTDQAGRTFTIFTDPEEIDLVSPNTGEYRINEYLSLPANAPSVGTMIVNLADSAHMHKFAFSQGEHTVTVQLQQGINHLSIWLSPASPVSGQAPPTLTGHDLTVTST